MAKKKKRSNARKRHQTQLAKNRKKTISAAEKKQAAEVSFKEEYHYVFGDLKRMGVLAAAMFALMIILAYVL